jgi:hypothetical protein
MMRSISRGRPSTVNSLGSAVITAASVDNLESPAHVRCPDSISYRIEPKEKTSERFVHYLTLGLTPGTYTRRFPGSCLPRSAQRPSERFLKFG